MRACVRACVQRSAGRRTEKDGRKACAACRSASPALHASRSPEGRRACMPRPAARGAFGAHPARPPPQDAGASPSQLLVGAHATTRAAEEQELLGSRPRTQHAPPASAPARRCRRRCKHAPPRAWSARQGRDVTLPWPVGGFRWSAWQHLWRGQHEARTRRAAA
eukprot:scaffold4133_cov310-Prasinococcus_capsulatus_cf.AAC.3